MKTLKMKVTRNKLLTIIFCCFSIMWLSTLFFNNVLNKFFNSIDLSCMKNCSLKVHFLDIGQADCTIIQFPNKQTMIIDAGAENHTYSTPNYICNYLKNNVLESNVIDYIVLTHSDSDHCLCMPEIFNTFEVKNVFRPATKAIYNNYEPVLNDELTNLCDTEIYANTIKAINNEGANIYYNFAGISFNIDDCNIEFLAPNKNYYLNGTSADALNAISAVIQLTYKNRTFLFTGDSNQENESELMMNCTKIDVLKVAHHGSSSSTSSDFIDITQPEYAVISVSEDNTYNMPSSNVLSRLSNYVNHENILRTDINGTIIFGVNNDSEFIIKTVNYETNIVVWWQVVIGGEIIIFFGAYNLRDKRFNNPRKERKL